jgi:hypothetical protein
MNDYKKTLDDSEECPTCNSFKPNESRSIPEKILSNARHVSGVTYRLIKNFSDYGVGKNIEFCFDNETKWAKDGLDCIKKYENIACSDEEHTLIIVNNKDKNALGKDNNIYTYGSGIDLLINYFVSKLIKFKIIVCDNEKCFDNAIRDSKAPNLWIFGHGKRHMIDFGEGAEYAFCKFKGLKDVNKKKFIAQLHCCHGNGLTLWEYLSDKPGIFSEGYRHTLQNREDIKEWIKERETKLAPQ